MESIQNKENIIDKSLFVSNKFKSLKIVFFQIFDLFWEDSHLSYLNKIFN